MTPEVKKKRRRMKNIFKDIAEKVVHWYIILITCIKDVSQTVKFWKNTANNLTGDHTKSVHTEPDPIIINDLESSVTSDAIIIIITQYIFQQDATTAYNKGIHMYTIKKLSKTFYSWMFTSCLESDWLYKIKKILSNLNQLFYKSEMNKIVLQ